jgi:hypothetical protein
MKKALKKKKRRRKVCEAKKKGKATEVCREVRERSGKGEAFMREMFK